MRKTANKQMICEVLMEAAKDRPEYCGPVQRFQRERFFYTVCR